jgi:ribokinase
MLVVFGSINLDLIFPLPHLPAPGQTVLGPTMRMEPGGKGANQAVAAARDGARVILAGAIGRDALAEDAVELLRESGVDISRVARVKGSATGCAAICVDPDGRNLIAVASAANQAARQEQVGDELLTPKTTVLLQGETAAMESEALIRRARAAGCRIVLNLAPPLAIAPEALRMLDVLVVNEDEAGWLAGHLGSAATTMALHKALGIDVVQTLGSEGCEAVTSAGTIRLPARPVAVTDTTGAGDCFTGVLAAALDRGQPLAMALTRANAAAALACTRPGTQGSMPLGAEIDGALG